MKNSLVCILCTGFATVTPLLLSKIIGYNILDEESLTDVCSLVFTNICEKKVPFLVLTAVLNVKYSETWRKMKILLTWYSEVPVLVHEKFLPASVFRARDSGECYTQKDCIHTTSSAFTILNLRTCVAGWNCAIGLILTPI